MCISVIFGKDNPNVTQKAFFLPIAFFRISETVDANTDGIYIDDRCNALLIVESAVSLDIKGPIGRRGDSPNNFD